MQRYFAKDRFNDAFLLEESDYHHIKNVMRMKEMDKIEVVYQKKLYVCHIEYQKNSICIILDNDMEKKQMHKKHITLIIPVLKEQKMDFILQKATELGVSEIIPVIMERCVVKVEGKEEKKLERWRKIVKEASEQSKRLDIPIIQNIKSIKEIISLDGVKLVCSTVEKTKNIKNIMKTLRNYDRISVVVGPEGGLAQIEEDTLIEGGYIPISLGSRILRVETVPLYILSILNYESLL